MYSCKMCACLVHARFSLCKLPLQSHATPGFSHHHGALISILLPHAHLVGFPLLPPSWSGSQPALTHTATRNTSMPPSCLCGDGHPGMDTPEGSCWSPTSPHSVGVSLLRLPVSREEWFSLFIQCELLGTLRSLGISCAASWLVGVPC